MIADQGSKLANLAKHIGEHGLSPLDALAVTAEKGSKFMVAEGNRRITALKILNNPDLAVGTIIEKKARDAASHAAFALTDIPCVVFPTRAEAQPWIDLKHGRGLLGVGVEMWSSIQSARASGVPDRSLEMLGLAMSEGDLTDEEKAEVLGIDFPLTNLQRLVNTPEFLARIGLKWQDDRYDFSGDKSKSLTLASLLIRELLDGKSVTTIKSRDQRIAYGDELLQKAGFPPHPQPSTSPTAPKPAVPLGTPPKAGPKRSLPKSNSRSRLIPSSFSLTIKSPKVNETFLELKRLRINDARNAVAVLFRVFLELSIDDYIARNQIQPPVPKVAQGKQIKCSACGHQNQIPAAQTKSPFGPTFRHKLEMVAAHMETNITMSKHDLKPVRRAFSDQTSLLHPDNFHAFVHHARVLPKETELKDMWDMIEPFVRHLW